MANKTKIEWTATYNDDGTVTPGFNWNFLRGCSRVSEGCRNCYAEGVAARFSKPGQPYDGLAKFWRRESDARTEARWTGEISFIEDVLTKQLRWKKPRKIFVNSMSDLFHEKVEDEWLDKAFAVMALTPQHTYQILTKRQERMRDYMNDPETRMRVALEMNHFIWYHPDTKKVLSKQYPKGFLHEELFGYTDTGDQDEDLGNPYLKPWPLPNVWLGVSVEDQKTADERIPLLLDTPAAVRWLSIEPLLGPVDLDGQALDWVVVGGESGPNARPMHPDWARSIRDQCQAAEVPFFFKQWGEYGLLPGTIDGTVRLGKKKAGRLLDGREWNEYPEVRNV